MSTPTMIVPAGPGVEGGPDRGPLVLDEHFAPVPEWVLDSPISDCALRLYAVLLRYGQTSGARIPSRATLARRLHKASTDTVDRAMRELVTLGAVTVEHRHTDGAHQTNRYHLHTRRPTQHRTGAATPPASATGLSQPLPARAGPSATFPPVAARLRPLARLLRPAWPQECGPTQSPSPNNPLPPPLPDPLPASRSASRTSSPRMSRPNSSPRWNRPGPPPSPTG